MVRGTGRNSGQAMAAVCVLYGCHLRADCLEIGIISGSNADISSTLLGRHLCRESWEYSVHSRLSVSVSVCLFVCSHDRTN